MPGGTVAVGTSVGGGVEVGKFDCPEAQAETKTERRRKMESSFFMRRWLSISRSRLKRDLQFLSRSWAIHHQAVFEQQNLVDVGVHKGIVRDHEHGDMALFHQFAEEGQ